MDKEKYLIPSPANLSVKNARSTKKILTLRGSSINSENRGSSEGMAFGSLKNINRTVSSESANVSRYS